MGLHIFEQDPSFVREALSRGEFDSVEVAAEVFEADFFRFIKARSLLDELSQSYPTPRRKEEVPLWIYLASNLSMRLHGVSAYDALPLVVRGGGMLQALGPGVGRRVTHPESGETTVSCSGFNRKNTYDRETPCDADYVRKLAKDTEANALLSWFNREVVRVFRRQGLLDPEGLFIGDASYLFVPDNPRYQGSVTLLFDEHDHPLNEAEYRKLPEKRKMRCRIKRCYKMVTLLHTNRSQDFFLLLGLAVVSGKEHECPLLYALVDQFVEAVGPGVMKRLILDRGFLDGEAIARCRENYGIDLLIPLRRNMDLYHDAEALFQEKEVQWIPWQKANEQRTAQTSLPAREVRLKSEVASLGGFESFTSCPLSLRVVASRDTYADGHTRTWYLLDTQAEGDPIKSREEYALRTSIEERYRQLKCFSDLTWFTSRAFSPVVNQVVFTLLAYDLVQLFLRQRGQEAYTHQTLPRIRQRLLPSDNHLLGYQDNYCALFKPFELIGFVVTLPEEARQKIAAHCRRIGGELSELLSHPRPP